MKRRDGFTIVELLIVIVIIAILAVITVVTYRGIQERSRNSQVVSGVRQYKQALEAYKALEGHYPQTTPETNNQHIAMVCLGKGYEDGYCGLVTGADVYEDEDFNLELARVVANSNSTISSMTRELAIERSLGSEYHIGATYGIDYVGSGGMEVPGRPNNSTPYVRSIQYALYGATPDCGVSDARAWYIQETDPQITGCIIWLEDMPNYR